MKVIQISKLKNIMFSLILIYPVINIFTSFIKFRIGNYTLYFAYSAIIFLLSFVCYKKIIGRIKISIIIFILGICFEGILNYLIDNNLITTFNAYISFVFCMIFFMIYSQKEIIQQFDSYLLNSKKITYIIQVVYYIVILLSVFWGDGIDNDGWGTISLKGPYYINHNLAYELEIFACVNLYYWMKNSSLFNNMLLLCNLSLILLTGVRSALISTCVALLFAFLTQKPQRKFIYGSLFIIAIIIAFYKTNLFLTLFEKTENSASIGSASGGREYIFKSSLQALFESNSILYWFVGIGQSNLLRFNRANIFMAIHAHNDFIDALVQYGLIGICLYSYSFKNLISGISSKKGEIVLFLIIFILSFFNGYYMYLSICLLSIVFSVFANNIKFELKQKRAQ